MSRVAKDVWARLDGERPPGNALWARTAVPDISERLMAALDADGRRHLLVPLVRGESELRDSQSRGISATTLELVLLDQPPGQYLDITCLDAAGHEAFDLIGGEIANRLSTGVETAPEVVARVLAHWRRFWGQPPRQVLSREAQLGLFGELWFLSLWLVERVGAIEAVNRWRGPAGARHDFEWPGRSIEVKTTTSTQGRIHRIHGLDQLAAPEAGELLMFSIRLREEGGATNTLSSAVSSCRARLEQDPDALILFENKLSQAGYTPAHEDEYAKLRLRVVEEGLFRVVDDFPRITHATFPAGVPAGVESVQYDINLAACGHLLIATSVTLLPDL